MSTPNPTAAAVTDPVVAALVERARRAHVALMQGDVQHYRRQIETSADFL